MRSARQLAALATTLLVAVSLTGCASHALGPQLAQLTAHVTAGTILPVTTGHGDQTLPSVMLHPGQRVGIEASCAGKGTVTVALPGGDAAIGDCSPIGAQRATIVFSKIPSESGPITVRTSVRGTKWNATVYYAGSGQ